MNRFKETKLDNGIRVITETLPYVQSFSLGFWFKVGSENETAKNNGISHFIEHMMFKGTRKRNAKQISDEVESLGGYLNAFTSKEHTCYYGRGLAIHIEKVFEVLADMVQNSVFDDREIKKESSVIVDELYDIEDTPEELIFDKFESDIYAGTPLEMPIIGTEENIRSFSRSDVVDYIENNYTNNRFLISVSGNVEHEKVLGLANKYISGLKKSKAEDVLLGKAKPPEDKTFRKNIQQTHVVLGKLAPGIKSPDRVGVNVLSHILGEGSSSRIFQSVRENHGLTYQINTFLNSFYDVSTFGVYFSTKSSSVEKATELINSELSKIKEEKVGSEELLRAKEYIKGNLILSLENTANRMVRMANSILYYNRIKPAAEAVEEIDRINEDDIMRLARKYLKEEDFVKIILSS